MRLPSARGPRSRILLDVLSSVWTSESPPGLLAKIRSTVPDGDPLTDDDLQLSLMVLYELHYRGVEGVDDRWEWHPGLLEARAVLEQEFESALREVTRPHRDLLGAQPVTSALLELTEPQGKPVLASYLSKRATEEQFRELLIHRSIYNLKEADPHTWGIPRLSGSVKAALVEIQTDEYGGGRTEWVHAAMFAGSMAALGLQTRYGHYLDRVPAITLAAANAMSLFGLHRRLRGALVGHLAAFEMTSTLPNRLYAQGLRRLGHGDSAAAYFDEHVEADAVHEQIALRDLAGGLAAQEPELAGDILFGACVVVALDEATTEHHLIRWQAGESSLRPEGDPPVPAARRPRSSPAVRGGEPISF